MESTILDGISVRTFANTTAGLEGSQLRADLKKFVDGLDGELNKWKNLDNHVITTALRGVDLMVCMENVASMREKKRDLYCQLMVNKLLQSENNDSKLGLIICTEAADCSMITAKLRPITSEFGLKVIQNPETARQDLHLLNAIYLVLDCVGGYYEMSELSTIISSTLRSNNNERKQILLFSDLFCLDLQNIAMGNLRNYILLLVGEATWSFPLGQKETFWRGRLRMEDKVSELNKHLSGYPQEKHLTLIFASTRDRADKLKRHLHEFPDHHVTSIHGQKHLKEMKRAVKAALNGTAPFLIVTDHGLEEFQTNSKDVELKGITHVVNFDMPDNINKYVERINKFKDARIANFLDQSNKNIARSIIEFRMASNLDVPGWLSDIAAQKPNITDLRIHE